MAPTLTVLATCVADALDTAATIVTDVGFLRHEGWTDRHERGAMGAEAAICVAVTGRVHVHPLPSLVATAVDACALALGDGLDLWADSAADGAADVAELLWSTAIQVREVGRQEAEEATASPADSGVGEPTRWQALCAEHRSPYAVAGPANGGDR
ncbi:hypothetical protein [Embleya sp. NPDC001921]